MDDALLVRRIQRVGDLPRDRQRLVDRRAGRRSSRSASVGPSTSSSTSAGRPVDLLDAVDRGDVRMVERREHSRLALESREAIRIAAERCGQAL